MGIKKRITGKAIIIFLLLIQVASAGKIEYRMPTICYNNDGSISNSMMPLWNCTTKVYVKTVTRNDNITVGPTYCYRPDYRSMMTTYPNYVCHILIAIYGDMCIFKGENNKITDKPVQCKYIAWKITRWE